MTDLHDTVAVGQPQPLPDFVADVISAEILRRWVEYLRDLTNQELKEFVDKLYPSVANDSLSEDGPPGQSGGTTSGGGSLELTVGGQLSRSK